MHELDALDLTVSGEELFLEGLEDASAAYSTIATGSTLGTATGCASSFGSVSSFG